MSPSADVPSCAISPATRLPGRSLRTETSIEKDRCFAVDESNEIRLLTARHAQTDGDHHPDLPRTYDVTWTQSRVYTAGIESIMTVSSSS